MKLIQFYYTFIYLYLSYVESELSLWEPDTNNEILNNWHENELEKLNDCGHEMIKTLGSWFSSTYSNKFMIDIATDINQLNTKLNVHPPLFRSSTSGRGKESGLDFIAGYNSNCINVCHISIKICIYLIY